MKQHYQFSIDPNHFSALRPTTKSELMGLPIDPDGGGFWDRVVTPARLQTLDENTMRFIVSRLLQQSWDAGWEAGWDTGAQCATEAHSAEEN